ncbi:MAG: hypothetical protein ACOH1U_01160 [Rhodoglobus sp.]
MNTINTQSPLQLDDGEYHFMQKQGAMVRLRKQSDGVVIDLHMSELSRRIVGLSDALTAAPRVLENLSKSHSGRVFTQAEHIREVLTGQRPGEPELRAEYDPELPFMQRVDSKIAELRQSGKPVSRATMMRRIKAFRAFGTGGLVDKRSLRQHGPLDKLDVLVMDALCHVMEAQSRVSTGTISRVIELTKVELMKRHGADMPALPSRATMYRHIQVLDGGRHTTGSAKTRSSLANRPNRQFARTSELLPGAQVQVDTNTMDVYVKTQNGPKRPLLTIMVDIATRSIVASSLRLEGTKGIDHVSLLAQALVPAENRPDRTAYRANLQHFNPQAPLKTPEELAQARNTRPFIYPRRVMMDNGRDYLSSTFRAALERYGIDITLSAPHTPTDKGIVERTFGAINTMFTQHLPGYVGRSPEHRGRNPENDDLLEPNALYELFDDWVLTEWQNHLHSSLRDRLDPSIKYSPNQMISAAAEVTSTLRLPFTENDYIELLPSCFRTITSTGIQIKSRHFDSPELQSLRNTKSNRADKNGKWEVKVDPYNPETVWLRATPTTWIECIPRDRSTVMQPFGELLNPVTTTDERLELARTNASITGVDIHKEREPAPELLPSSFPEDDGDESELFAFDPFED